ncbi:DNA-directed rna polymerase III 25 kd polypeptide [Tricladium varicosporioides]|nr:DNA-directed rna polymerase III 25 kd polypeptide [Hymenoscyphus varicosporioides]
MFILTKIADLVQIKPEDFDKDAAQAIEDNINEKFSNRVIQKIGLCVCLYDLLSASEGLIGHGTGLVNVNVEFRLIVFRPFKNEVMVGIISSSSPRGIRIRLNFFEDILVPPHKLPPNTHFSPSEQVYIWDAGETDEEKLYFDNHEKVRFRIEEEKWHDQSPQGPGKDGDGEGEGKSPYSLVAAMDDSGLGPCLWWDGEEGVEEGMEE